MMAVHLAAGEGTRLRPHTDDTPKPLVDLGGASLLEHNLATLRAAGVDEHVVVTGHQGGQLRDLGRRLGFETVHNDVYDETEMVFSLFCAAHWFPVADEGDLVISYGDIVYERSVADALLACDAPMCVVVDREWRALWEQRFDDPLEDAETLELDEDGRIRSIGGVPDGFGQIDAQYTGLLKVRNDHVGKFVDTYRELEERADGYVSIDMTAFLQRLVESGWFLQAVPVDGGWLEVDTVDDLELYRSLEADDRLSRFVALEG